MSQLHIICVRCEFGNADKKCQGPCPCRADPEKRDILVHIANASNGSPTCPKHYHDGIDPGAPPPAPMPPLILPGLLEAVPRELWPVTAIILEKFSRFGDDGLGDAIKRILTVECESGVCNRIAAAGARLAVLAHLKYEYPGIVVESHIEAWIKGENQCGNCEHRRKEQNAKYPLR